MILVFSLMAIIGYVIGLKTWLLFQIAIVVGWIAHFNSDRAKGREIGIVIDLGMYFTMLAFMAIGNIVYAFYYPEKLLNAFRVVAHLFTP